MTHRQLSAIAKDKQIVRDGVIRNYYGDFPETDRTGEYFKRELDKRLANNKLYQSLVIEQQEAREAIDVAATMRKIEKDIL